MMVFVSDKLPLMVILTCVATVLLVVACVTVSVIAYCRMVSNNKQQREAAAAASLRDHPNFYTTHPKLVISISNDTVAHTVIIPRSWYSDDQIMQDPIETLPEFNALVFEKKINFANLKIRRFENLVS